MVVLKGEVAGWGEVTNGVPPGQVLGLTLPSTCNESGTKMRSMLIKFEALIQKRTGIMQKKALETFERPQE